MDSAFGTDVSVGDGGGGSDGTGRGGCSYNSTSGGSRVTPLDWRRRSSGSEKAVYPTMPSKNLGQQHVVPTITSGLVKTTKGMERGVAQHGSLEEQRHDYSDDALNSDGEGDDELEELFRRNERTMHEIRCDLKLLQSGSRESELDHTNNKRNNNDDNSRNTINDDGDCGDIKRQSHVHEKQQPRKDGGETAETGVGGQLPSRKTPPPVVLLRGGDNNSQRRAGGIQIPGPMLQPPQDKVLERNRSYSCSEPPSVSELLLQLRHDDNASSSSSAVRCSQDGTRKEGGFAGNKSTDGPPPRRKRPTRGKNNREGSEVEGSTGGQEKEERFNGGIEGVGYTDTKGGVVTLVNSNARALLMS